MADCMGRPILSLYPNAFRQIHSQVSVGRFVLEPPSPVGLHGFLQFQTFLTTIIVRPILSDAMFTIRLLMTSQANMA